jgi:outer membrane cobalamin receptor
MLRRQGIPRLFQGVSAVAVCAMATGGQAWAQEASKKPNSDVIEEVVVTARRAAIESSQMRKKNAEVIVADDAGKLPDHSLTDVLQRVSGVSIVRFAALGDPDHFSAEGSSMSF